MKVDIYELYKEYIEGLVQNYCNYIFFRKSLFYIFLLSNM